MTRALDRRVHALVDGWWDPGAALLTAPTGRLDGVRVGRGEVGLLAPTLWWVHGLLRRGAPDDRRLARAAVTGVLAAERSDGAGTGWPPYSVPPRGGDGSGPGPARPPRPDGADRAASGLAVAAGLALLLEDHRGSLAGGLGERVADAVVRVGERLGERLGAALDGRGDPVSVLEAGPLLPWVLAWVGAHADDGSLRDHARAVRDAHVAAARRAGHLPGACGPTTAGELLLAYSLWAARPPAPGFAAAGEELRDLVWRDVLDAWHPRLRTLAPPLVAPRGLDLREHVGAVAPWLAWLLRNTPALPPLDGGALHEGATLPAALLVAPLAGAGDAVRARAEAATTVPVRTGTWTRRRGATTWTGFSGRVLAAGAERGPVDHRGGTERVHAAAVWQAAGIGTAWLRIHLTTGAVVADVAVEDDRVVLHLPVVGPWQAVRLAVGGVEAPDLATVDVLEVAGRRFAVRGVARLRPVAPTTVPDATWEAELDLDGDVLELATAAG